MGFVINFILYSHRRLQTGQVTDWATALLWLGTLSHTPEKQHFMKNVETLKRYTTKADDLHRCFCPKISTPFWAELRECYPVQLFKVKSLQGVVVTKSCSSQYHDEFQNSISLVIPNIDNGLIVHKTSTLAPVNYRPLHRSGCQNHANCSSL